MNLTLPWPPVALSPNTRSHWAVLAKAKKAYRLACYLTAIEQGAHKLEAKSLHLEIVFYPPTRRKIDLDNALARMKSGLDGLCDVLGVDDANWRLTILMSNEIGGFVKVNVSVV